MCYIISSSSLPPPVDFQRLPQNTRVSQALNGDLYFSNVLLDDTRNDYICYARFPHTQTIQQKQPITVKVLDSKCPSHSAQRLLTSPSGFLNLRCLLICKVEAPPLHCLYLSIPFRSVNKG